MPKFIIHIGPSETGEACLQQAFAAMRRPLADHGVLYPPIWGERCHNELPERLANASDRRLERQFIELHDSGFPVVLLSAEGLASLDAGGIEYLRTLTRPRNSVRIVFYARSWGALLLSHWRQTVRNGSTQTFREFLLQWGSNPADCDFLNFAPNLRRFADRFGAHAIDIVSYDAVLAEGMDIFRHFAATFLDWRDAPAGDPPQPNGTADPADIEILRALHAIEKRHLGRAPEPLRSAAITETYLRLAPKFDLPALRRALAANLVTVAFAESDQLLARLHRALFTEFREALAAPRPHGGLFPVRQVELPHIRRDYLLVPEAVSELRRLHGQVLAEVQQSAAADAALRRAGEARLASG